MMDELELLKKDWQKKEEHLPKLSHDEIHKMIWKKSSSIVKWILIISILEFLVPHLFYFFPGMSDSMMVYEKLGLMNIFQVIWVVGYIITFYFIYSFYKRYKEISVLDNAKELMEKIIKTRKTVKHYIIYSLSFLTLTFIILIIGMYLSDNLMEIFPTNKEISPEKFKTILLGTMAITSAAIIVIIGGLYFLLYGLLLRKLKRNYRELKKMEV